MSVAESLLSVSAVDMINPVQQGLKQAINSYEQRLLASRHDQSSTTRIETIKIKDSKACESIVDMINPVQQGLKLQEVKELRAQVVKST